MDSSKENQDVQIGKIINVPIEDSLKQNYLTYAMSVIIGRYIPDVRDGLKPVHRRIIYSMSENNLSFSAKTRKCAKIVGEVLGNYHPHGDSAVYEALVRMAQDFSMRYPLILGQGNFGSIDGDPPAAMRYTESKLQKIADFLVQDIDKNTVDFIPNYDNTTTEPTVLPARFPNLLVNGSIGIAVAMSTNIPPHNLSEIIDATIAFIDDREICVDELMQHVKAPDFPTGGVILGTAGIRKAYETGKGSFYIRGKANVEEKGNKEILIITEIPYGIKKSSLIIDIANLVKTEVIKGISEIRDESNKEGMRIVIEIKKGTDSFVLLNTLYSKTQLQVSYSMNLLAIVDREPKLLSLRDVLHYFVLHRKDVIIRRANFLLSKAQGRIHIVEGLLRAIDNMDEVIKRIRASQTAADAKKNLIERFELSDLQAQAILELRLQKLTALEKLSLEKEKAELDQTIVSLLSLLGSQEEQYDLIKKELLEVQQSFKTLRKTDVEAQEMSNISMEEMIPNTDCLILITTEGILKRTSLEMYRTQRRGGQGKTGAQVRGSEEIKHMLLAKAHDYFVIFTNLGNVYYVKTYDIPESSLQARGRSIYTLLSLKDNEKIASCLTIQEFNEDAFVLFVTKKGMVKKTNLAQFVNARKRGIIAIHLQENDELLETMLICDKDEIFITTQLGKGLRISSESIRSTGRSSQGVIGIRMKNDKDFVVGVTLVDDKASLIAFTEKGFGKRVSYNMFTPHARGTGGQVYYGITKETGAVVAVEKVFSEEDEVLIATKNGMAMRLYVKDIRIMGRAARGNRVFRLKNNDIIVDCSVFSKDE
jgi:DNA gyrase subunit A